MLAPGRTGTARSSAGPTCPPAATSCTTSVERVQQRARPRRARHRRAAAALPAAARAALLQHPRLRHPPGPASATLVKTISAAGAGRQGRLLPAAHPALRAGRDLRVLPRRRQRRTTARAASPCSTTTPSTCCGPGRPTAGTQYLAYDAWWHLNQNTLITSEWGTPSMIEDGVNPELLLGHKYGHRCTSGTWPRASTSRRSTWAPSTRWRWSCARRTTPRRPGASSAWWSAPRTCPRSVWRWSRDDGELARRQGDHHPGRAGRRGRPAAGPASRSARCRRWSPTSTCRSTTSSSTSRAGAPASSSSTT